MNLPAPNFGGHPLKVPHREPSGAAAAEENSTQSAAEREMVADMEALREREINLREYEARLRAWQEQLDARSKEPAAAPVEAPFVQSPSQLPFSSDSLLASSWEKFHRARALLEAEQKQLRDERMAMKDAVSSLKQREAEVAAREASLAKREKQLAVPQTPAQDEKKPSAMERLTRSPFRAARSAFKPEK